MMTTVSPGELLAGTEFDNELFDSPNSTSPVDLLDYDLDEALVTYNLHDLIPTSIVYGLTLIIGLLGNSLIIFTVAHYKRMYTINNVFLASLASADLLLILVCVPVKFGQLFSYTWTLGEFLCKFVHYIQNVSAICSVLTLTSMSVERYYAIIHPMISRYMWTFRQARRVIAVIWIVSLLMAMPIIFVQIHLNVGRPEHNAYWCIRDWDSPASWRAYELYMLFLILVIPTIVMVYTYTCICYQLWIVVRERAIMASGDMPGTEMVTRDPKMSFTSNQSGIKQLKPKRTLYHKVDDDNATVKQVIKMLVAVVLLFILCWAPILITNVLTAFGYINELNYGYLKPLRTVFHLMSYFNSCVNPCVYGFMSQTFRHSFLAALQSCVCADAARQKVPDKLQRKKTASRSGRGRELFHLPSAGRYLFRVLRSELHNEKMKAKPRLVE